jgi:membrane-associated phospholipid phosphatase
MLQYLNLIDHKLFECIQIYCRTEFMDPVFAAMRDKHFWIPVYIFLTSWICFQYGKSSWKLIMMGLIAITITDQLNSSVLKPIFQRERPCKEIYFKDQFSPVINCSGGYSFPSSHATNHMALAVLLFLSCGGFMRGWKWLLIFWAVLVSWSQVYVGVHFPFDVMAGWIEGAIIAWLLYLVLVRLLKWQNLREKTLDD